MSAYIVSKRHIDLLAAELTRPGNLYGGPSRIASGAFDPNDVGRILIAENIASVGYRYDRESLDTLPGPVDKSDLIDYHYTRPDTEPSLAQVLKAVESYTYQSCEHPGWEGSQAARWMRELTSATISRLPGYEEAAWTL